MPSPRTSTLLAIVAFGGFALLAAAAGPALALSNRTLLTMKGAAAGDNFGVSVAGIGDFNGDGHPDMVVGAWHNDAAGADAGRAYIHFGGPGADAVADLVLTGAAAGDQFGYSVAGAGDVNDDGFTDVIVGAFGNDAGGAEAGRAYVYFGGLAADATPDLTLTGAAFFNNFGSSVAGAGDVNGDGFDDLIVGAWGNDAVGVDAGRAYVYHGSPVPDATADLILTGAAAGDQFGITVAGAGDMDGDGFDEVVVGAIGNDLGGANGGQVYFYRGGLAPDALADAALFGGGAIALLGRAVAGVGDVNGDGLADVGLSAVWNGTGSLFAIYLGSSLGGVFAGGSSITSPSPSYAAAIAGAGDVNGDGIDDLIIGDYDRSYAEVHAYPFQPPFVSIQGAPGEFLGIAVAGAGDVNRDGFDDVIVGVHGSDVGGADAGRAQVTALYPYEVLSPNGGEEWTAGQTATVRWRGHDLADLALSSDGGANWVTLATGVGGDEENAFALAVPSMFTSFAKIRLSYTGGAVTRVTSDVSDGVFRIAPPDDPPRVAHRLQLAPTGAAAGDQFGVGAAGAGDVNGDGYPDLIVGASRNDAGGADAGRAYLYYGGPGADAVADLVLTGAAAGDLFGLSVGGAGDMNRDGFGDVIVGASQQFVGGAGRAHVFFGGPAPDAVADLTLTGAAPGDLFGVQVAGAGDVNGDGFDDVFVGASRNDAGGTDAGRAYVYLGGPAPNAVADLILTGAAANDRFGLWAAGAGDMNGDGFDDLVVGADGTDLDGQGRANIYFGGAVPDAASDLVLRGAGTADLGFGTSVAGAGDVNGDGFDDVIVGAVLAVSSGIRPGKAYVYFGGPGMNAYPDLAMTGEGDLDNFGHIVAGAGDVNGDGFADVIVSARVNAAGGTMAGRAYAYFGGPGADGIADLVLTGAAAGDAFGGPVAGVGDPNGDGFDDILVGAVGNDQAGADAGKAYLYDLSRYVLLAPNDDEVWNVGATATVSWRGAEPADLSLSVDGGATWLPLRADVGGAESNLAEVQVPHLPTRFARIKVSPHDPAVAGDDRSDSLFTIQSSVALLNFVATLDDGGAELSWSTEPGVSPGGLAGYRLYRSSAAGEVRLGPELIVESRYTDAGGTAGSRYRLVAVNGLGVELEVGRVGLAPARALAAWPLPYRGGTLEVSFATAGGLGGGRAEAALEVYDVSGRRLRTVARGTFEAGYHSARWDGLDDDRRAVPNGLYFLRARGAGHDQRLKIVVAR